MIRRIKGQVGRLGQLDDVVHMACCRGPSFEQAVMTERVLLQLHPPGLQPCRGVVEPLRLLVATEAVVFSLPAHAERAIGGDPVRHGEPFFVD